MTQMDLSLFPTTVVGHAFFFIVPEGEVSHAARVKQPCSVTSL